MYPSKNKYYNNRVHLEYLNKDHIYNQSIFYLRQNHLIISINHIHYLDYLKNCPK